MEVGNYQLGTGRVNVKAVTTVDVRITDSGTLLVSDSIGVGYINFGKENVVRIKIVVVATVGDVDVVPKHTNTCHPCGGIEHLLEIDTPTVGQRAA